MLRRNLDLIVAVVVLVMVNAILFAMSEPRYVQGHEYLHTLRQIAEDTTRLQRSKATPEELAEFRGRSEKRLEPMIADLEGTATAREPIRQHLLWAARDSLREQLSHADQRPAGSPPDEETATFEEHLGWVEARLAESDD